MSKALRSTKNQQNASAANICKQLEARPKQYDHDCKILADNFKRVANTFTKHIDCLQSESKCLNSSAKMLSGLHVGAQTTPKDPFKTSFMLDAKLVSKTPSRRYFQARHILLPSLTRFVNQLKERARRNCVNTLNK